MDHTLTLATETDHRTATGAIVPVLESPAATQVKENSKDKGMSVTDDTTFTF